MINLLKEKLIKLFEHKGFRKYFFNTGWLFAGRVFQMGVAFFVGVWVARYLGPSKYGLLSFARSFVGLFVAVSTLGLNQIVIRELVKDESRRDVLLGTSFFLKLSGAFLAVILIALAINFTTSDSFTKLLVFIVGVSLILQPFDVIDLYFQSKVISKYSVIAQMVSVFLSAIFKVFLILSGASLIWFAVVGIFDIGVKGLGYLCFYIKKIKLNIFSWRFDISTAESLLKDSWPLIISGIAIGIYMKIDQVMIKYMIGDRAVGLYSVAVRLSELWYFIPVIITSSLFPAIINAKKVSQKEYITRIENLYRLLIFISLIISASIFLFSKDIILITFGEKYYRAFVVLEIYIWSTVFVFLNNASWKWYIAENLQVIANIRLIVGAIVNVFLNFVFIKKYGIVGAAWTTIISYSIATYFGNLFSSKTVTNFKMQTKALFTFFRVGRILYNMN